MKEREESHMRKKNKVGGMDLLLRKGSLGDDIKLSMRRGTLWELECRQREWHMQRS